MQIDKYFRRPFTVEAVLITDQNFNEVATWCEGTVKLDSDDKHYIHVKVRHPLNSKQTKAYVGDWVLKAGEGFKVYGVKAFEKAFQKLGDSAKEAALNMDSFMAGVDEEIKLGGELVHKDQGTFDLENRE